MLKQTTFQFDYPNKSIHKIAMKLLITMRNQSLVFRFVTLKFRKAKVHFKYYKNEYKVQYFSSSQAGTTTNPFKSLQPTTFKLLPKPS